jgi:hypothetical protein
MKHYVYKLEDKMSGEFYFGSRTCYTDIEDDDYMGSMKIWKPNKKNLKKVILKSDFENREDTLLYEKKLVEENIKHPLNRNYSIPNTGFYYGGKPETNPNYGKVHTNEWKLEQSKRMKQHYQKNKPANLGRKFSEGWRNNISESRIKLGIAKGSNNGRSYGNVKVIDLSGNELIFDTAKEASIHFKVDRVTLTNHCKNGTTYQRGKLKGYIFELTNTYLLK